MTDWEGISPVFALCPLEGDIVFPEEVEGEQEPVKVLLAQLHSRLGKRP